MYFLFFTAQKKMLVFFKNMKKILSIHAEMYSFCMAVDVFIILV